MRGLGGQGRGLAGVGPGCPLINSCWASHAELDGWEGDSSWLREKVGTRDTRAAQDSPGSPQPRQAATRSLPEPDQASACSQDQISQTGPTGTV